MNLNVGFESATDVLNRGRNGHSGNRGRYDGEGRQVLTDDMWERIRDMLPGRKGTPGVTAADNRLFSGRFHGAPRRGPGGATFRNASESGTASPDGSGAGWRARFRPCFQEDVRRVRPWVRPRRRHGHGGHRKAAGEKGGLGPAARKLARRPDRQGPGGPDFRGAGRGPGVRCRLAGLRAGRRESAAVIPSRSNSRTEREHDRGMYGWRHRIDSFLAGSREFRAVATRYDRTVAGFRATFLLAAAVTAAR